MEIVFIILLLGILAAPAVALVVVVAQRASTTIVSEPKPPIVGGPYRTPGEPGRDMWIRRGKVLEWNSIRQEQVHDVPRIPPFVRAWREEDKCDHGVVFDPEGAHDLSAHEVRERWPRLDGACPLGCGYFGTSYASLEHYVAGDW